jgi:hypothetical protein
MLHQRAFDFKRADHVPRGLDDVVGASDEPIVAVCVAPGEVTRDVPAVLKALAVPGVLVKIAAAISRE